ncbi:hypothetical protein EB796_007357 [Bugula neritina]|uniref:G-protein coupled receptors family 1 profile domain-containing protein n=1 Tax=Bugula neritina TaxID=10212 RepID=A0A7J7K6U0_BUGNE|nr:hypothetical protein EB796_007357 [Bugula neritina]
MENNSFLCEDVTELCADSTTPAVLIVVNLCGVVCNILNLIVLKTLDKSKRNRYFWIVVNIGISDIATGIVFTLYVSCDLNRLVVNLPRKEVLVYQVVINILGFATYFARNLILVTGSYERYVSICQPFNVQTNKVLNNLGVCLGTTWIASLIVMGVPLATNTRKYCFGVFGSMPMEFNTQTDVVFSSSITITLTICVVLLFKTWKELKRMQQRNAAGPDDLMVKRSAQYIMIICITFYLLYVPAFLSVILSLIEALPKGQANATRWISMFYQTVYGIMNIVVYIVMTPGYSAHILRILRIKNVRVQPSENVPTNRGNC